MLPAFAASIFDAVAQTPSAEDQRAGVYVCAAIVGLITSGIISVIKELRAAASARA